MKNNVLILCLLFLISTKIYALSMQQVSIELENGKTLLYQVETATTFAEQQQGLMYRNHMPKNQGMLFDFSQEQIIHMWMKNTYIPLDMLFLDKENKIVHIVQNTTPLDEKIISSLKPVKKVLELNAGEVQKHQLKIGMKIDIHS